jgi:hypothetical protein
MQAKKIKLCGFFNPLKFLFFYSFNNLIKKTSDVFWVTEKRQEIVVVYILVFFKNVQNIWCFFFASFLKIVHNFEERSKEDQGTETNLKKFTFSWFFSKNLDLVPFCNKKRQRN